MENFFFNKPYCPIYSLQHHTNRIKEKIINHTEPPSGNTINLHDDVTE